MSWKTILVPHDFSSSANHAAALARDEAKVHGAKILLLHVIDIPPSFETTSVIPPETGAPINAKDYAVATAEKHLEDIAARLAKDGATATTFIRVGNPVDQINIFAGENNVDLIIMGTHGRSGLQHLLVGSVAERIVRTSVKPVLTIRHPT
ncbi:MAG: universal stress protein [Deltaproteobacteria bacterium]|nr:universal stress protein [Deltaproteobacteria bacterium]